VCGSCPPAAPTYTNAYLGLVSMDGGSVSLNVVSQNEAYAWCALIVSNNVSQRIYNWSVSFTLTGGTVQQLYDATPTQTGGQVYAVARQYNCQVSSGAALVITFRVLRSGGEVRFGGASMGASGLGPQPIRLAIEPVPAPAAWRVTWDDNAYVYNVECTTNLLTPQAWKSIATDLSQPEITDPLAVDGAPHFYRVKGTLY